MRTANRAILFDWGGTLMRDFREYSGPMAHWPVVECLPGARPVLEALSGDWQICLATNAADSDEALIWAALQRGGLKDAIEWVFCYRSLGFKKPDPAYFWTALARLELPPESAVMVGDDFEVDVQGAVQAGLKAIWLNEKTGERRDGPGFATIERLAGLPQALFTLFEQQEV